MKLKAVIVAVVIGLASQVWAADRKPFGIGVIAGEPTGISLKYMLSDEHGIDLGAGWETTGDNEFHLHGDYLFHLNDLINVNQGLLPVYVGLGARWLNREDRDDKFGMRIPAGVVYVLENLPLAAFGEVAPVLNLTPDTDFDLEGGVGIRFFF